ncbi:MAG TPA: hypothetical protein VJ327_11310 [Patescibacteria group bacterium]|nr:hypothetical protein [Patescibacteria group bacterium]
MALNYDPIGIKPKIINIGDVGIVPYKIPDLPTVLGARRIRIFNLHTIHFMAYSLELITETPSFTATTNGLSLTDGIIITPTSDIYINIVASLSLWVVASEVGTPCQVVIFDSQ